MKVTMGTVLVVALAITAGGCVGQGAGGQPSAADRQTAQDELAGVQQSLGEASCGTTTADAVLDMTDSSQALAASADGSYGHPDCTDGFVVDIVGGLSAGQRLTGGGGFFADPDPFTCLFHYGYLSLWQKQGSTYVKVQENSVLGTWFFNSPGVGTACRTVAAVTAPADGDYRVVVSAGELFGSKMSAVVFKY